MSGMFSALSGNRSASLGITTFSTCSGALSLYLVPGFAVDAAATVIVARGATRCNRCWRLGEREQTVHGNESKRE